MSTSISALPKKVLDKFAREGALGVYQAAVRKVCSALNFSDVKREAKKIERILAKYTPTADDLGRFKREGESFEYKPLISVLVPVYNTDPKLLKQCLESVLAQVYPHFELCIADDASTRSETRAVLEEYKNNPRVKIVFREINGHIAEASNSALKLCSGEFIALLDHDDLLAPHALFCIARELNRDRKLDYIYSNEDKIDLFGTRSEPTFKCNWSPEYFRSFMYVGHLSCIRTECVRKVGGFRKGFEGSQDYDLLLRVSELEPNVLHIPEILYHWRMVEGSVALNIHAKPYAFEVAKKALDDHAKRLNLKLSTKDSKLPGIYRPEVDLNQLNRIAFCVEGDDLRLERLKVIAQQLGLRDENLHFISGEDQISLLSKVGLEERAEIGVMISSAIDLPDVESFKNLLSALIWPEVGVVGGVLVSEGENLVLHAGYVVEKGKIAGRFCGLKSTAFGYGARLEATHNVSAVSLNYCAFKFGAIEPELLKVKWRSPEALCIALSLAALKNGIRTACMPGSRVNLNNRFDLGSSLLRLDAGDAELLDRYFQFHARVDPYYPVGLNRGNFDFEIES